VKRDTRGSASLAFLLALCFGGQAVLAQDGFINCRKFADGIQIQIDGDPSDWPLDSYGDPAELPDVDPAEQVGNNATSNAVNMVPMKTGDHFVFDPAKVLMNDDASFETEGDEDFQATTYIAWDDAGFYVLNIVTDNLIGWFHGRNPNSRDMEGQTAWQNDGIELWFDNDNDREPPNIQDDQTSQFDLQLDISIDNELIQEEFGLEPFDVNGMPLEIQIYRSAWNTNDDQELEILNKVEHAVKLDDKPAEQHTSYVQEIMIPWETFPSFEPDEPIGFNVNWMDWDEQHFQLMRWHQANESSVEYFREMRFTSDSPLGGTPIADWSLF